MTHRFSSLTLAAVALVAATAGGQENAELRIQNSEQHSAFRIQNSEFPPGQHLIAEAARRVANEPAISAELRYRIDAFGHELVGTGNYLQYSPPTPTRSVSDGSGISTRSVSEGPADKLVRLDLRMQVGDKPATVQEIRGEESYWIRRDVPPLPTSLGRVDLRQLRKSLAQAAPPGSDVMPQGDWIMLGGLSRLLAALDQNFAFAAPRAEELQFNAADGKTVVRLPIWKVAGQWKPERLDVLTEREPGKARSLPQQLPDRVELVLGRTEDVLPLFPYSVTYWRTPVRDKKGDAEQPATPRELLTLEFFNVSRKRIDPREFQYSPGDQDVRNLTPFYVQRYSSETKLR